MINKRSVAIGVPITRKNFSAPVAYPPKSPARITIVPKAMCQMTEMMFKTRSTFKVIKCRN